MTRIKICGITTLRDALSAVAAGADYLGFNFYSRSPRFVQPEDCAGITTILRREHAAIQLVGVFVNAEAGEIETIMNRCALDLAQLHGDESAEFCRRFGPRAFKAIRGMPDGIAAAYARSQAPAFLADAAVDGAYGGTGQTADWNAAATLASRYPLFLAGGLNPENVEGAVRHVRPWGVDTASGVESSPGSKDAAKMRAFVRAVRRAADHERRESDE